MAKLFAFVSHPIIVKVHVQLFGAWVGVALLKSVCDCVCVIGGKIHIYICTNSNNILSLNTPDTPLTP